jgi:rod shape-determining protein MreC
MPSFLSKRKNLVVLISLVFFQMILISIQVPLEEDETLLEKLVYSAFAPIQHGVSSFFRGIGSLWNNYFVLRDAQKRNRRLSEKNFSLLQENIILKQSLRRYQNEAFLQQLYGRLSESVIGAQVIGMDSASPYKSVVINRGTLDGLAKNMVVLDASGNLVGRVFQVTLKEATVQLITDDKSGVSVTTAEGRGLAILKGRAELLCELDYSLTTDEEPKQGDTLLTTGFDYIYPPGIKVGIVLAVEHRPELFKYVRVQPFFRLRELDRLAVIGVDKHVFY